MIKKINLFIYYLIGSKMPSSFFPMGYFFNYLRTFLLKSIIKIGSNNKIQPNVYIGKGKNIKTKRSQTVCSERHGFIDFQCVFEREPLVFNAFPKESFDFSMIFLG